MLTAAEILSSSGIRRATEVIELAGTTHLELAAAATLLVKESGGGANVWGHDAVNTGGTYVKGGEVTREAYLAYKARRAQLGAQGCGPCQLTWPPFQDAADDIGGCWDWRCNVRVGFQILADNIRRLGLRSGFRAYNGSGAAAEAYADDAMAKLTAWRNRLSVASEDTDLTPDQDQLLRNIWVQLVGPGPTGGWESWGGGTGEKLTLVDYNRRANVEVRQSWNTVQAALDEIRAARADIARVQLGGVDLDALAEKVADLLAQRLAQ